MDGKPSTIEIREKILFKLNELRKKFLGEKMDTLAMFGIILAICIPLGIITTIFQYRLRKKQTEKVEMNQQKVEFIKERIYQMEDGSLAKYIGNGKFLKVKMK